MNLVCFSNNTAGGLVCDLLNNKQSLIDHYKTTSNEHNIFKIDDTPNIQLTIDLDIWNKLVLQYNNSNLWYGTHAHPSCIPNLNEFTSIIAITTESRQSKLYRWLRYYHGWFKTTYPEWSESDELDKIDKIRCLAKNVFEPFVSWPGCDNIEFEDIISGEFVNNQQLNTDYFNRWKTHNFCLYPVDEQSWAVQRFDEAEFEILNNIPYRYI